MPVARLALILETQPVNEIWGKLMNRSIVLCFVLFAGTANASTITFQNLVNPLIPAGQAYGDTVPRGISGSTIVGLYDFADQPVANLSFSYDTATNVWTSLENVVIDGVSGPNLVGTNFAGGVIYSPSQNTWTGFLNVPAGITPNKPSAIDGSNLVGAYTTQTEMGGAYGGSYLYNAATQSWILFQDPDVEGTASPGLRGTFAQGISGNVIVGFYQNPIGEVDHGFIYNMQTQAWTTLDDPNALIGTVAYGVSGNIVVGMYDNAAHGFMYNMQTGVYTTVDDPSGIGTSVLGIQRDTLVGTYQLPGGAGSAAFIATVPEPSSIVLCGLAAIGFLGFIFVRFVGEYRTGFAEQSVQHFSHERQIPEPVAFGHIQRVSPDFPNVIVRSFLQDDRADSGDSPRVRVAGAALPALGETTMPIPAGRTIWTIC